MKNLPIDLEIFPFYEREKVNDRTVKNSCGRDFLFYALAFYFQTKIGLEKIMERNEVSGLDISIGYGGLLDHVLFVYGYDAESLCVFDTIRAPVQYESVDGKNMNMMKISKNEIKERWTHF